MQIGLVLPLSLDLHLGLVLQSSALCTLDWYSRLTYANTATWSAHASWSSTDNQFSLEIWSRISVKVAMHI